MKNIDEQQIEDYLRDKLPPDEREAFEAALAADPELRRRTAELRLLALSIRKSARADIRERAEAVSRKIRAEEEAPPKGRSVLWSWLIGSIGVAVLLWLGYSIFFHVDPVPSNGWKNNPSIQETPPATKPIQPGVQTPVQNQNSTGKKPPIANAPKPTASDEEELGQSAVQPFASELIAVTGPAGQPTGRKIRVKQYRDPIQMYIFKDNLLEIYLPKEKNLPSPLTLQARDKDVYLKLADGKLLRLEPTGMSVNF